MSVNFVVFTKDSDTKVADFTRDFIGRVDKNKFRAMLMPAQAKALRLNKLGAGQAEIKDAEFAVAIGGDGTMLRAARMLSPFGLPILGVNLGRRGFLTEVKISHLLTALPRMSDGDFYTDERMMLEFCAKRGTKLIDAGTALNDIVIGKNGIARIIRVKAFINEKAMTVYSGDGLIVSTPTGSTGHNLSAGGPIIDSSINAFVLSAICPLSLSNRPVVIGGNEVLSLHVEEVPAGMDVLLTSDGQSVIQLKQGDDITINRSSVVTKFARLKEYDFFSALKERLGWEG